MDSHDMDVDMDIDLGPLDDIDIDPPEIEQPSIASVRDHSQPPTIDSEQTTPHKIHVRGVDDLTTNDIKSFSAEHFPSDPPTRIEWIDDTSANIVFDTPSTAFKALNCFTSPSIDDLASIPTVQLRAAKTFSTHPELSLQVRTALFTDQKRPRAYEASRFYMMHPEYDPREKRRRDHSNQGDYRRRRYGNEEHRRRRNNDDDHGFNASMYDDDPMALAGRESKAPSKHGSYSAVSSDGECSGNGDRHDRFGRRRGDSFRPGRNATNEERARFRSASPDKGGDSKMDYSGRRRSRRRTPPPRYQASDPHPFPKENKGKELFPRKPGVGENGKELFPNKRIAANLKKELFPHKTSNHRRSDAFDAADETADLFATGMHVPFTDGVMDVPPASRSLAESITIASSSSYGRLIDSPDPNLGAKGLSIRGASQNQGILIRGIANEVPRVGNVKELFPGKSFNAGKELFAEKLLGRGGRRNKAVDMFY